MGNPFSKSVSSESVNPDHGSTSSSPPVMERSQPSPTDPLHPSPPMDSRGSIRKMDAKIDSVEEKRPSKRFKFSESTNPPSSPPTIEPSQPSPVDSVHPFPSMDAMESIREMYEKIIDPLEQINPLISFVEDQLHKMMNTPSEAGSSASEGLLETVRNDTKLAATTIDTISGEVEKLSKLDALKAMESLTLKVMEGVGALQCVVLALSVAAFAAESYMSVSSRENECRQLLLKILQLAKDVKRYSEQFPDERGKLCNAIGTIVEGVVICCDSMKRAKESRFWSATTVATQLGKTNQQLKDVTDALALCSLYRYWDKDVFLSHSGKQKNFVRQLHRDLTREHVSCFFDEDRNSLPLAHRFPRLIFKAAEACKIAVLVLSKEFICSKWPMLELSAFIRAMNSGRNSNLILFPIFFKIGPKELNITKDCPEWQEMEVNNDTRVEWQDALRVVRSINGLPFREDENEVALRDKVVKAIDLLLRGINRRPQLLDFQPVGIEKQVEEVKALLDMEGSQSALAVIVCGFGGVGKSTVAACVIHSLDWSSTNFKFCRVEVDQHTPDKTSHIMKLQKNILYDLGGEKAFLRDPHDGRLKIRDALRHKCSLLLIDNVVDKNYVRDLLPKDLPSWERNTKLRIIITSREKNVRAELAILCKEYEVQCLSDAASKTLLSKTILESRVEKNSVLEEERMMINEVAAACRGVPLFLSVFGKHLRVETDEHGYQQEIYEEALEVLRDGNLDSYRDEDLGTTLMFVYDKIKDQEVKEAFLDICIYFHGWEWNFVLDIVDFPKLQDLRRRTLVSKSSSGEVIVHDILRFMGMKKATLTRFSNYKELSDALENNLVSFENVKGISLLNDNRLVTIRCTQLEAMYQSLRVLMLGDWVTLDERPCQRAFRNLRYLRVGDITVFPFEDPSKLDKLRVFMNRSKPGMNLCHLPPSLKRIYHEVPHVGCDKFAELPFQKLTSLKSFIVKTQKSVNLPKELHLPASLVHLDLNRCKNLPKDMGNLVAVESLTLDRSDLEYVPFGKLQKLKHLSMDNCSKLAFLSEELGMLSSLEALSMKGCGNLRALPESLGGLLSLQTLELSECINLQVFPESFGELRIQLLNFHSLVNLNKLPNSFGKMPLLKDLNLESCHSLVSLPDSFVQLKMLETLNLINCTKLTVLPKDFGRLRCLKGMTVKNCHLLKELPNGFGALQALKSFTLLSCDSFVNLPSDFTELTSLEELRLYRLPLMSRIPDGFGKLKRLSSLEVQRCDQLKTLSEDFENMATLERLSITDCSELDGAMMEKILKLQNCYIAQIKGSKKLSEKWKDMQGETENPIMVLSEEQEGFMRPAIRVALLNEKFMELNYATDQLMERPLELEEGTNTTVALIMLPPQVQIHEHQILQGFVEQVREKVEQDGSGKLQIVCARKVDLYAERWTPTEKEKRAEEEDIRQILQSLPKGSCAIPSSECKRVKILTWCCDPRNSYRREFNLFMANVGVDIAKCEYITANASFPPERIKAAETYHSSIQNDNSVVHFIESISPFPRRRFQQSQSQSVAGESKTEEFMQALKDNDVHYLLIHNNNNASKVMVDELHGKAIGFMICDFKFLECIKLQQIYKILQQRDSNFIWIWIPTLLFIDCKQGTYTRLIQCMPWATFPHHQLVNLGSRDPYFVLLDKQGQIANSDAWPLLLGWGVKSYPFTLHTIPEAFFMESESCLEFLLQGMNIVGRKPMKKKLTILYADSVHRWLRMKTRLEQVTQIHASCEVLYVGKFSERKLYSKEDYEDDYENAIQNMRWLSLSFSDMITFWYRCEYLANYEVYVLIKDSNIMMETLHGLADHLYPHQHLFVVVDNRGLVARGDENVVEMICKWSDEIWDGEGTVKDELRMQSTL